MKPTLLNVCALGEPMNPSVWSRTPFNICSELKKINRCDKTFNADISPRKKRVLDKISFPFYGKKDLARSFLRRYACAYKVIRKTNQSLQKHTLHTGTLTLPFLIPPAGQKHYLFCDTTWNAWSRYASDMDEYPPRAVAIADTLEKRSYEQMTHIFPTSHYIKENLVSHYGIADSKITVAGTGLGAIRPSQNHKDYTNGKILFAAKGAFKDKGGDLVVSAFKKALALNPRLYLTIIGNNDAGQDDCPQITNKGFVSPSELQRIFEEHSLFIMPARNEVWGLVYLEAMACKMPIVGFAKNSFPEFCGGGKHGFSLKSADPKELAEIIIEAFRNPQRLKDIGERAYDYCLSNYTWEKTISTIIDTIERIHDE